MFHVLKRILESGILVSDMSTVWEDTDGCKKKYGCDLAIYLMTVLSSSYDIIMDRAINALGHVNVFCWNQCNGKTLFKGTNGTYW